MGTAPRGPGGRKIQVYDASFSGVPEQRVTVNFSGCKDYKKLTINDFAIVRVVVDHTSAVPIGIVSYNSETGILTVGETGDTSAGVTTIKSTTVRAFYI